MRQLIMFFINWIVPLLKKDTSSIPSVTPQDAADIFEKQAVIKPSRGSLLNRIDFSHYQTPAIQNDVADKKTLLILDDIGMSKKLYSFSFNYIKRYYGKDIENDFKIIWALGDTAGFDALKYLVIDGNKVDFAMLDITLPEHLVKFDDGNYIEIDGIDVGLEALKNNPACKVAFTTVHTYDLTSETVKDCHERFYAATNQNLEKYFLNKNSDDRAQKIYRLLYGE